MTRTTVLRLVVLVGLALAIGPALGVGLPVSLAVAAAAALLAHERRVVADWRQAPGRLSVPR